MSGSSDRATSAGRTVQTSLSRRPLEGTPYRLRALGGHNDGREIVIGPTTPGRVHVGTSAACELVLEDVTLSRRHASFELAGPFLHIADADSTNGTFVNGVRIERALLSGGETVVLGATQLVVERLEAKSPNAGWPVAGFGPVIGASDAMKRLYPVLQRLAAADVPVMIEGETGAGKKLVAEAIHEMSVRKTRPLLVCDCAAVDPRDAERVLFGEIDPTTRAPRPGLFEEATGGSVLMAEVTELPLLVQAKVLRLLERRQICRVRDDRWIDVDVRLLATSKRNVEQQVERGHFREDLFLTLGAGRVFLPALRQRDGDVPLLAAHIWRTLGGADELPADALERYEGYTWPGNIRELRGVLTRRMVVGGAETEPPTASRHEREAFVRALEHFVDASQAFGRVREAVLREFERVYLEKALGMHGGNISRAAAASGIARRYFYVLKRRQDTPG